MADGKRIIIFTGGRLDLWALADIEHNDVLVGADRGALFLIRHNFRPHIALGDFDSVTAEEIEEIRLGSETVLTVDPIMKDWTDTEMALDWAMTQQPGEIIIKGALGSRLDHTLANVHLLWKALQKGIQCKIVDEYNEVLLIDRYALITKRQFTHCSLLPFSMEVTGVTLTGFRYPLEQAVLTAGQSLGISNVIEGPTAQVSIHSGLLLVILSRD